MTSDKRLVSERFPRSSKYHPKWVIASASGGANALWLTEWLAAALDLRPGMRVLDLGYVRLVGRRRAEANLDQPIGSIPMQYTKKPLLRSKEPRF
jgi:hypothetical protein